MQGTLMIIFAIALGCIIGAIIRIKLTSNIIYILRLSGYSNSGCTGFGVWRYSVRIK